MHSSISTHFLILNICTESASESVASRVLHFSVATTEFDAHVVYTHNPPEQHPHTRELGNKHKRHQGCETLSEGFPCVAMLVEVN